MNENNRNTRTLIVSFVVAIMALIPLRFVEIGQQSLNEVQVLGVTTETPVTNVIEDVSEAPVLEEPYNEIENRAANCFQPEQASSMIADKESQLSSGTLNVDTINQLIGEIKDIESLTCK